MKKLLFVLLLGIVFISCKEKGQVTYEPEDFIIIHGKTYKLVSVVPCENCREIWIMYPKDSLDRQPTVINYSEKAGKTSFNQAVIKVD